MKTFLKWAMGLAFLAVVIGAASKALPDHLQAAVAGPSSFDADIANIAAMRQAEDRVRQVLKDPDSAKFGSVHLIASINSVPPPKPETDIVCGYVNAKNSFGAYTGASRFIAIPGVVPAIEPSDTDANGYNQFFRIWNRECAGKQPVASL